MSCASSLLLVVVCLQETIADFHVIELGCLGTVRRFCTYVPSTVGVGSVSIRNRHRPFSHREMLSLGATEGRRGQFRATRPYDNVFG